MANSGVATSSGRSGDRWWRSLAARATIVVGTLLIALSSLLIATNALVVRQASTAAIERAVVSLADQIANELEAGEITPSRFASVTASAGLDYAYLEGLDGSLLAGTTPAGTAPHIAPARLDATGGSFLSVVLSGAGELHAAKRVFLSDGRGSTLRIGMSNAAADAAAREAAIHGLMAALCFLALTLPLLAFVADRFAAPLRDLTRAVSRPGAAQEAVRIAGSRRDEVGALARAHLTIARDLAENADALHRLTFDDALTRLPNRASLLSRLAVALQLNQPLALLKFEVQGLSRVAAGLGQQFGDEAVRRAAERLGAVAEDWAARAKVRDGKDAGDQPALLARGSDSGFALLARGADANAAREIAEAALAAFETPLQVGDHHVTASLSVGVALAPEDGDEAGALLRSAAAAVSAARAAGPQSIRFAGAELTRMAYGRLKLEQDLRRAIEQGELDLHFQPQIAIKTGLVSGVEALVRWRHPIRGMVSPGEFVPLAEECGLIEPLGRFVLSRASRTAAEWRSRGLIVPIAVNVSPIQFKRQHFAETTLQLIRAAGADPSDIELEITESAAMGDPEHAARELAPLKAAGMRIAIDDFGTGYSNLSALTRLPFDVLKIDRAFVRDALTAPGARVVVGAIIGLAENLGFATIAEGVETAEQLDFVTETGCTHVQGFLFGRPMPADAFEVWYADRLVSGLRALGLKANAGKGARLAS